MPVALKKASTVTYLHQEHLGSSFAATDGVGSQTAGISYLPYGGTRSSTGSLPTDRKFTGQRLDGTGLYYYGARYYDPEIGRFVSADALVPLGMDTPFALDYEIALRRPKPKTPRIVLTEIEEQEFEAARFQSRLPIHITGESVRRRSNLVGVAGNGVALPDALFKLFLRLVLAIYESKDGFLSREGLRCGVDIDGEGALAPEGLDQALGRLREPFRAALGELVPTQFIEVRGGKIRLSTHPRYVTLNLEGLLQHRDEVIRAMASLLKDATHGNAT